ncbi:hypothetical protein [Kribbella deserti]|uniref:Glycosyl hydrolase family 98 putative carbohydrate-binding module domain-containing protein n=1 Tax=Kribbella deserti TaxID=1926257 RepID=A0ABV6QJJ3_9ACTN
MKKHLATLASGLTATALLFPLLGPLPANATKTAGTANAGGSSDLGTSGAGDSAGLGTARAGGSTGPGAARDTAGARDAGGSAGRASAGTAAGSVRAAVSLTTPPVGAYGSNARFSGTAWRYGTQTKLAGATIVLQRAPHGKATWINLTSARTTATGTFAMGVTLSGGYDYRAYYAGSTTYTSAVSAAKFVFVSWKVILDGLSTTDNAQSNSNNGTLNAKGRVYPAPPTGTTVWLQKYDPVSKKWKDFTSGKVSGNTIAIKTDIRGNVSTWRLSVPSRNYYFTGSSNSKQFAHYVWRGLFSRGAVAVGGTEGGSFHVWADQDPLGGIALARSERGGLFWAEIRTTGCLTVEIGMHNYSNQQRPGQPTDMRFVIRQDGELFRSVVLKPGGDISGGQLRPIGGIQRIRLEIQDAGHTGEPLGEWRSSVLCSN